MYAPLTMLVPSIVGGVVSFSLLVDNCHSAQWSPVDEHLIAYVSNHAVFMIADTLLLPVQISPDTLEIERGITRARTYSPPWQYYLRWQNFPHRFAPR